MKVASNERNKGHVLFLQRQWKDKGFEPKEGEQPYTMWANQFCNPRRISDYFYDWQVQLIKNHMEDKHK